MCPAGQLTFTYTHGNRIQSRSNIASQPIGACGLHCAPSPPPLLCEPDMPPETLWKPVHRCSAPFFLTHTRARWCKTCNRLTCAYDLHWWTFPKVNNRSTDFAPCWPSRADRGRPSGIGECESDTIALAHCRIKGHRRRASALRTVAVCSCV